MPDNQVVDRDEHDQAQLDHTATTNIDAHMPPQPGGDPVWANTYNPDTNEWAPSNEQHSTFGVAEPSHGDAETAEPMVNDPGDPRTYTDGGGVPDARPNLLDAVRGQGVPLQPPPQRIEHHVYTEEVASTRVRARVIAVVGNNAPTVLLEENQKRDRALIKVLTAASTILISPVRQGGQPAIVGAPTLPGAFWPLIATDGNFEVKSQAGVEAIGTVAAGTVILVAIWEEMRDTAVGIGL